MKIIEKIPTQHYFLKNPFDCFICLKTFNEGDLIKKLECQHIFHGICLNRWVINNINQYFYQCPSCNSIKNKINDGVLYLDFFTKNEVFFI